jgi:hypothetical protein
MLGNVEMCGQGDVVYQKYIRSVDVGLLGCNSV